MTKKHRRNMVDWSGFRLYDENDMKTLFV